MELVYLTTAEQLKLEQDLHYLSTVKRKEIAEKLREATSENSDFEDNVAYEVAKMEQGFLEWRIREIETLFTRPIVVDQGTSTGIAQIGSTVTILEHPNPSETYTIVGTTEADPRAGKISYRSPMGKALIGCCARDEVSVSTPSGDRRLILIDVR